MTITDPRTGAGTYAFEMQATGVRVSSPEARDLIARSEQSGVTIVGLRAVDRRPVYSGLVTVERLGDAISVIRDWATKEGLSPMLFPPDIVTAAVMAERCSLRVDEIDAALNQRGDYVEAVLWFEPDATPAYPWGDARPKLLARGATIDPAFDHDYLPWTVIRMANNAISSANRDPGGYGQ